MLRRHLYRELARLRGENANLVAELAELRAAAAKDKKKILDLEGERDMQAGQIEMFVKWQQRELERLDRETAQQAALKVQALNPSAVPPDESFS